MKETKDIIPLTAAGKERVKIVRQLFKIAQKKGFDDNDIASVAGQNKVNFWRYRSGTTSPNFDTVIQIASALNLKVSIEEIGEKREPLK